MTDKKPLIKKDFIKQLEEIAKRIPTPRPTVVFENTIAIERPKGKLWFDPSVDYCHVHYSHNDKYNISFDDVEVIRIGTKTPLWRQNLCHELGHIILDLSPDIDKSRSFPTVFLHACSEYCFMVEHFAWRLAKTICKPEWWDEDNALRCLKTYWKHIDVRPRRRFPKKIVPLGCSRSEIRRAVATLFPDDVSPC